MPEVVHVPRSQPHPLIGNLIHKSESQNLSRGRGEACDRDPEAKLVLAGAIARWLYLSRLPFTFLVLGCSGNACPRHLMPDKPVNFNLKSLNPQSQM